MEELISFGNKRDYDEFKKQIPLPVQPLFDLIRNICLSLGKNVVEDVRMHRIVFGKSMTFRWFADIEPQNNGVMIKIQKNRKKTPKTIQVILGQETTNLNEILQEAYDMIH